MIQLTSLGSNLCLAAALTPPTIANLIGQLERDCRDQLIADIPTTPHLDDMGRATLQGLVDAGASTRQLADTAWFNLFAARHEPTWSGVESLFAREPGRVYARDVNPADLRANLSANHFAADLVMNLNFPDEAALEEFYWGEATSLPYIRLQLGFSLLFLETPIDLVHLDDRDELIIRVPSLTLIESAFRALWRSDFQLVMTPNTVDDEIYAQLKSDRYHAMGVSLRDQFVEDREAEVSPLVFMGHELLAVVLDPPMPDRALDI